MKNLNSFAIFLFISFLCQPLWAQENLTWLDCLSLASQNHPDVVSAKESIRQSKDSQAIATSALLPQAQASLSVTQVKAQASGAGSKLNSTTYAYGLSGSQLLFDSFKTINSVKASAENVKASQWNFQYVSSQVRLRLRSAFVNLLKAQELIQLTKQIYDIRKQNLDLITKSYNSGMEHKGALMTAQANLAEAEFEIHQADRGLQVAQRNLLKEVGSKSIEPISIKGSFDIGANYQQTPNFDILVDTNPQLLQLIAQKNSSSFNVKSDLSGFGPSVSLLGGVGKTDDRWPPSVADTNVGLKLTWPLLEGGARAAQLDKDKSALRSFEAQERSLRDALVLALEQSWASLSDAIEQVDVQKKFLDANQERADIAKKQYSVGLLTFDNWTIIEDNLVSTKKAFLNTQANALLAEANWIEAQGRTLEYAN
ncbi:MAG: TolC family protein [Candidatus Omnitrophota bacterium]